MLISFDQLVTKLAVRTILKMRNITKFRKSELSVTRAEWHDAVARRATLREGTRMHHISVTTARPLSSQTDPAPCAGTSDCVLLACCAWLRLEAFVCLCVFLVTLAAFVRCLPRAACWSVSRLQRRCGVLSRPTSLSWRCSKRCRKHFSPSSTVTLAPERNHAVAVLGVRCGFTARRVVALMDYGFRNLSEGANSAPEATASDSERGAFTRSGGGSQEILAMVIHVVFLPCLPIVSVACDKNAANLVSQRQGRRRLSGTVPSILVASAVPLNHISLHTDRTIAIGD